MPGKNWTSRDDIALEIFIAWLPSQPSGKNLENLPDSPWRGRTWSTPSGLPTCSCPSSVPSHHNEEGPPRRQGGPAFYRFRPFCPVGAPGSSRSSRAPVCPSPWPPAARRLLLAPTPPPSTSS